MRFSVLQKHILKRCYQRRGKISRHGLNDFYQTQKKAPAEDKQVKIITQSLERLIDREQLIGYGVRTPHKWYIKEIKLTPLGRKTAKKLMGEQQKLPI